jgi:DNA polymerase
MTKDEKEKIAFFLDIADSCLINGFYSNEKEYNFSDDIIFDEYTVSNQIFSIDDNIKKISNEIQQCILCSSSKSRKKTIIGYGAEKPIVLIIGNVPTEEEENIGYPFQGQSGNLLDKMINSIGLYRDKNCYLTNVVKCRTNEFHTNITEETTACAYFLHRQILTLNPKIILCLGTTATQSLMRTDKEIQELRGIISKVRIDNKIYPITVSYHPSEILKNTELKRPVWEDLKKLKLWIDSNFGENNIG